MFRGISFQAAQWEACGVKHVRVEGDTAADITGCEEVALDFRRCFSHRIRELFSWPRLVSQFRRFFDFGCISPVIIRTSRVIIGVDRIVSTLELFLILFSANY